MTFSHISDYSVTLHIIESQTCRDGHAFLKAFTFAGPSSWILPSSSRIPTFLYDIFFAFSRSLVPVSHSSSGGEAHVGVASPGAWLVPNAATWGCSEWGGGEHHPWPLAGGQSCVTQCIWGREHCVSSSLSRNTKISIHILSCSAFPHSWIKFAFPGASVPEIPGTWERRHAGARELGSAGTQENKTRNACPSLQRWCSV